MSTTPEVSMTPEAALALRDAATPEPWDTAIEKGCHAIVASIAGEAKFVAIIFNVDPDDGHEETRFANARLIAAAPTLATLYAEAAARAEKAEAEAREIALQYLATDGEAQEALDRAGRAEAEVERLRQGIEALTAALDLAIGLGADLGMTGMEIDAIRQPAIRED